MLSKQFEMFARSFATNKHMRVGIFFLCRRKENRIPICSLFSNCYFFKNKRCCAGVALQLQLNFFSCIGFLFYKLDFNCFSLLLYFFAWVHCCCCCCCMGSSLTRRNSSKSWILQQKIVSLNSLNHALWIFLLIINK